MIKIPGDFFNIDHQIAFHVYFVSKRLTGDCEGEDCDKTKKKNNQSLSGNLVLNKRNETDDHKICKYSSSHSQRSKSKFNVPFAAS